MLCTASLGMLVPVGTHRIRPCSAPLGIIEEPAGPCCISFNAWRARWKAVRGQCPSASLRNHVFCPNGSLSHGVSFLFFSALIESQDLSSVYYTIVHQVNELADLLSWLCRRHVLARTADPGVEIGWFRTDISSTRIFRR